jgi:DUF1680 family protein
MMNGDPVGVQVEVVKPLASPQVPSSLAFTVRITCERPLEFSIKLRIPWWIEGQPSIDIAGQPLKVTGAPSTFICMRRSWQDGEVIYVELPKRLSTSSLPDSPEMAAFMHGPVVLAGLLDDDTELEGDMERPESVLSTVHELEWYQWRQGYRMRVPPHGTRFIPLYDVRDERYTLYFRFKQPHSSSGYTQ